MLRKSRGIDVKPYKQGICVIMVKEMTIISNKSGLNAFL